MDTSFLVSLFSADANTALAVQAIQASRGVHLVSTLGELEGINALQLRVFRKEISQAQAKASLLDLERDFREGIFQLVSIPDKAFQKAQQISLQTTARLGTRSADLLALELEVDCLLSFDKLQRKLAQTLRLKVSPSVALVKK